MHILVIDSTLQHVGCYARRVGCYAITGSAASGCQYPAVKMAANTEAVSAQRPASGTKISGTIHMLLLTDFFIPS
jgi:hypothetical protein